MKDFIYFLVKVVLVSAFIGLIVTFILRSLDMNGVYGQYAANITVVLIIFYKWRKKK